MHRARLLTITVVAIALVATACNKGTNSASDGDPAHPKAGDVFLEAFDTVGGLPFTKSVAFAPVPAVTAGSVGAGNGDGVKSVRGSTSGLYGGSGSQMACDATSLATLLADNEDNAQAWVDALNDDTTLQWTGGAKLSVDDVPTYLGELTPVVLLNDTRVTDHGVRSGRAVARQAVLQRGTALFVDQQGMPRVRCAAGSPLTTPEPAANPKYRGEQWDGFSQRRLVIVTPATRLLETLRVRDVHTRDIVEISVGSACLCDHTLQTTTTSTTLFVEEDDTTTTSKKPTATTTTIKRTTTSSVATTAPATTSTTHTPATTTPPTTPATTTP